MFYAMPQISVDPTSDQDAIAQALWHFQEVSAFVDQDEILPSNFRRELPPEELISPCRGNTNKCKADRQCQTRLQSAGDAKWATEHDSSQTKSWDPRSESSSGTSAHRMTGLPRLG